MLNQISTFDFVANGLIYPSITEVEKSWNSCAMIDIDAKRIVPITEFLTPKHLHRATKLLSKDYLFCDNTHLERMVSRKDHAYYPSVVMFKSSSNPSIGSGDGIICATQCEYYNPNRDNLPEEYNKFINACALTL